DVLNSVRFLGRVPDDELVSVYQGCDVFVMPSRAGRGPDGSWAGEGFGIVYIEASACGKPVVGSNQGGAAEAVVDGTTGFAVDPTSIDAIAEAVCELLKDPALRQTIGEDGRRYVVENFSLPLFEQRVARLLTESGLIR
ncbi:MAG: glycosyltransferase family 4 protein, partial [Chloroflexi bacterium]|nr:glycosyltransferase family 4 protein [Chloroflexota bacterium]